MSHVRPPSCLAILGAHDKDVGLHEDIATPHGVSQRAERLTEPVTLTEDMKRRRELPDDALVLQRRRGAHQQLAVHEFVPLAITRDGEDVVDGVEPQVVRWHAHRLSSAAPLSQVGGGSPTMPDDASRPL